MKKSSMHLWCWLDTYSPNYHIVTKSIKNEKKKSKKRLSYQFVENYYRKTLLLPNKSVLYSIYTLALNLNKKFDVFAALFFRFSFFTPVDCTIVFDKFRFFVVYPIHIGSLFNTTGTEVNKNEGKQTKHRIVYGSCLAQFLWFFFFFALQRWSKFSVRLGTGPHLLYCFVYGNFLLFLVITASFSLFEDAKKFASLIPLNSFPLGFPLNKNKKKTSKLQFKFQNWEKKYQTNVN